MPFAPKRRGTHEPRLATLLRFGWFLALLLGSRAPAVASSPSKKTVVVVVADRPLVRISYSELLDVFGEWEDVGANQNFNFNFNNNNNNSNKKNGDNDDSPDDRLATILRRKRDKILPLLSRIEAAFGRTGGQGVCGIGIANGSEDNSEDSCAGAENPSSAAVSPPSLGFLEVTHVPPEMAALRRRLLPRAAELANLPGDELRALERPESGYSIGWSHGKESFRLSKSKSKSKDKSKDDDEKKGGSGDGDGDGDGDGETRHYDTAKGSFYLDPFVPAESQTQTQKETHNVFPPSLQPQLEADLLEMTRFMARVGLWIAALCDYYLLDNSNGNGNVNGNSEHDWMVTRSLLAGRSAAKARLLYYFPREQQERRPEEEERERGREREKEHEESEGEGDVDVFDDWCGWHTDHGSLTALLPGMLLCGGEEACSEDQSRSESESESALGRHKAGLYIKTIRSKRERDSESESDTIDDDANDAPDGEVVVEELVHVDLAVDSLGFQLGETLEILSGRTFRATPHAVRGPGIVATGAFGRASLALFLQPRGSQALPPLPARNENENKGDPLSLRGRWRGTFGEFQKTTIESFS